MMILIISGCYNKWPETGWLKQQKCISDGSEGWKSEITASVRLGSWWGPYSWLCPHMVNRESDHLSPVSAYKGTDPIHEGPTLKT